MELNVDINPEQINKEISEAIAKSAIGETLAKQIKKSVDDLSISYNNPFESIIKDEINNQIRELVQTKYKDQIREAIAEKLKDDFVDTVIDKLWDFFSKKNDY